MRARLAGLVLLCCGLLAAPLAGQSLSREYDVKAAFLYNFATFIEWPATAFVRPDSPFVIGVMGTDPFGASLEETVAGERIKGRAIVIKRFTDPEQARGCHIVFISAAEKRRVKDLLRLLSRQPIATVADMPDFVESGGLIGFSTGLRVSIKINPTALRDTKLTISSKLLRLAQVIETEPPAP